MAKFRGLETPGSPFPVVKGLPTSTCRLTTQPNHIMSCLVEIYKSWIRLWSALDSLCNVSSVNWFFFFFFWESCSGSFIHPDTATSCLCLHFVQLGRVIMDFINQHRIKRNILDSLLKILNFFFFVVGRHILDIYSSSISDSGLEEEQEPCHCEKLMFSVEHERSDQTLSASPSMLILWTSCTRSLTINFVHIWIWLSYLVLTGPSRTQLLNKKKKKSFYLSELLLKAGRKSKLRPKNKSKYIHK